MGARGYWAIKHRVSALAGCGHFAIEALAVLVPTVTAAYVQLWFYVALNTSVVLCRLTVGGPWGALGGPSPKHTQIPTRCALREGPVWRSTPASCCATSR